MRTSDTRVALVVTNDFKTFRAASAALEKYQAAIITDQASDGEEAQEKLCNSDYHIILSDLDLPKLTGTELLSWTKENPTLWQIPFIMFTENEDLDNMTQLIKQGADTCLPKPFTVESLIKKYIEVTTRINRRAFPRYAAEGSVLVKYGTTTTQAKIINISMGGILCRFDTKAPSPSILDRITISIKPKIGTLIQDLETYPIRIESFGSPETAQHVKIAMQFQKLSPKSKQDLNVYMRTLRP